MLDSPEFWFIVVATLILYLCASFSIRMILEESRQRRHEPRAGGHALDAGAIAPHIEQLRRDHAAAARCRSRHSAKRQRLLGTARRTVLGRSYFCHEETEHNADHGC